MKKAQQLMLILPFLIVIVGTLSSCATVSKKKPECEFQSPNKEISGAVKWYRLSAERKALYQQSFAVATRFVKSWVAKHKPKPHSWGVVLDIDETVLDNTWYFEQCGSLTDTEAAFSRYISLANKSVAQPGAINFLNTVHKLGGYISFVTNRDGTYSDQQGDVFSATEKNLREQNIYFDQIIFGNYTDSKRPKDKQPRLQAVITGSYDLKEMVWTKKLPPHQVIAYLGDNIEDFPEIKQKDLAGLSGDDKIFKNFSKGFFILPNPIYGSWQRLEY